MLSKKSAKFAWDGFSELNSDLDSTNALGGGRSKETETGLNAIGTGILEVLERLEHVTDQCIEFGRAKGVKMRLSIFSVV